MVLGLRVGAKGAELGASVPIIVRDECEVACSLDIPETLSKDKWGSRVY